MRPSATTECLRCGVFLRFQAIPPDSDWSTIMSQLTHSLDSSLLVRDVTGDYRVAADDKLTHLSEFY
jgi:hypothetical protein